MSVLYELSDKDRVALSDEQIARYEEVLELHEGAREDRDMAAREMDELEDEASGILKAAREMERREQQRMSAWREAARSGA